MLSIGSLVYGIFGPLGIFGLLAALFIIFYFDATVLPTLPELFTVIIFLAHPVPLFGVLMVATLSAAEFCGVTTLYLLVRRYALPQWMRRRIVDYSKFLIVRDEKVILVNRVAPIIPFLGAFMATCDWPYGRSVVYNFAGGAVKYGLIIIMASYLLSLFSNEMLAEIVTIITVLALICASYLMSAYRKRRMRPVPPGEVRR